MSLDDFVITYFTKGPGVDTLSTKIYAEVRKGIKPEMYSLSTILFVTVLLLLLLVNVNPSPKEEKEEAKGANVSVNGGTISGDVKVGENVKSTVEGKEPLTVSGDYNMTKDSEGNYTIAKKPTSYYYYPSTSDTTTSTTTKGSPKTFDAGIALYVGMALTSAAGVAFVGKKRED